MNRQLPGLAPMDVLGMNQLQLMQMVPTAGKLGLAGAAAEARAAGARERAVDMRWEVRTRVAAAFYDIYRTERSVEIALADVEVPVRADVAREEQGRLVGEHRRELHALRGRRQSPGLAR